MRGFPLINTAVILLALGLILLPLAHLTSSKVEAPPSLPAESQPVEAAIPVTISARFAHAPTRLTLTHLGRVIWQADSSAAVAEGCELLLDIPREGIDLLVHVVWPENTPESALELSLEPTALAGRSQILWGEGEVEDVLTFTWQE